jgi:hypothetical protein
MFGAVIVSFIAGHVSVQGMTQQPMLNPYGGKSMGSEALEVYNQKMRQAR